MKQQPNILECIANPKLLGAGFKRKWLRNDTWKNWRAYLCALFALPFEDGEALQTYRDCTARADVPRTPFAESYLICGRRSGKTYLAAAIGTFLAGFRSYDEFLAPGEVAVVAIVAADRGQAQLLLRYIRGFIASSPLLKSMVLNDNKETIVLNNNVEIQVLTGDYRSVRGRTLCAALIDELAFMPSGDGSASPDSAVLEALKPGLVSIPGSVLIGLSSPYSKRGELYRQFKENFGVNDSPVLIWKAPSIVMNPSLNRLAIAGAFLRDAASAKSEYLAEFRDDVSGFLSPEAIEQCVVRGRLELAPMQNTSYSAFTDSAGGQGSDSFVLAVAHEDDGVAILDCVREVCPPFSPEQVVGEFANLLRSYGCSSVVGDRFGAGFVVELFEKAGISYTPSELTRSQLYLEFLPALTSGQIQLLDHPRLLSQLISLERKPGKNADTIDHPPGNAYHDDVCNAACGAVTLVAGGGDRYALLTMANTPGAWQKIQEQFTAEWNYLKHDVFGRRAENPRTDNLDKKAMYEFEKKLRGVNETTLNPVNAEFWKTPQAPPCPKCKAICTNWIGADEVVCNQCSHQWPPSGQWEEVTVATRNGLAKVRTRIY